MFMNHLHHGFQRSNLAIFFCSIFVILYQIEYMEFIILPLIGLGGLYVISNQERKKSGLQREGFGKNRVEAELLPNTDVPDNNYSDTTAMDTADMTSKYSTVNKYDGGNYIDKYFKYDFASTTEKAALTNSANPDTSSSYKSLTGESVDLGYFRHNNMAPFFGSKSHENNLPNATESTLDNYSGSGSQHITKAEQSPMFKPGDNYQWANGMPSTTDFVQSRQNTSMKYSNTKPFEEVRVGPGLGLGYTSEGSGGFNSGLIGRDLYVEKNVDQLRVDNKQKASGLGMFGYEGPAVSATQQRPQMGIMEKNRVERTFEMGLNRAFTTTGVQKGETLRPITVERFVNRPDTTMSYVGAAGQANTGDYVSGEYQDSTRQELGPLQMTPAYASGRSGGYEGDYGVRGQSSYTNNRMTVDSNDGYFGILGGVMGSVVAPLMDILKPSRKENTIGALRPYQNAKGPVERSYMFNPDDTAPVTMRQLTENSKMHLNVNAQTRGAYDVTPQQVLPTMRPETSVSYTGIAEGATKGIRNYDAEYNQRNNDIKSSTINGRMVAGNMKLFNGEINMKGKAQENMLLNRRQVDGARYVESPGIGTMGIVQGNTGGLYSSTGLDRNNGDILGQLRENPYHLQHMNGI